MLRVINIDIRQERRRKKGGVEKTVLVMIAYLGENEIIVIDYQQLILYGIIIENVTCMCE